jgi:hypothetical protein
LPVLERGAILGLQRSTEAIGRLGDTKSFETMLLALERHPERCSYIDFALYWLVRRSNKKIEEWMIDSSTTTAIRVARIPRWRTWWDLHKKDFRVIKSQDEAINDGPDR